MNLLNYKIKKDRNYGIDFLRIISMFFIVILHCLGRGGLLASVTINSPQYKLAWLMEITAFCAVDVFALISGYASFRKAENKVRYEKLILLWLQVVFINILVTGIFLIIRPELVTKKEILISFFPISMGPYWYFTAYAGMFIFLPLINKAIEKCDEKTLKYIFISIIIVFSFFETFFNKFYLINGYSLIWISILYVLGAIMKKCDIGKNIKPRYAFIGIIALYLITYLYKIYGFEYTRLGITITKNLLINYISPTILGISILYIICFSKIKFNDTLKKIIIFLTPSVFSVYLFNDHNLISSNLIYNRFTYLFNESLIRIIGDILIFSTIFFIISILLDKIRIIIFNKIHIDTFSKKVVNYFNNLLNAITKIL